MTQRLTAQINHLHRIIEIGDVQCVVNLRMKRNAFAHLCYLLTHVGGLGDSRYVRIEEKVAMFLSILAHHKKNRIIGHDYVRSGQTISAHFHEVLGSVLKLHTILLVRPSAIDDTCTDETWKWFKGCVGALDGSAADARVLRDALTWEDGLKVQRGCYYLCNNGYANVHGFLTPYRRVPYHRDAWGNRTCYPQNFKELFNWRHSKARNVIERAFGLLKKRWAIMRSPCFYPLKTQNRIIMACILLHNFIRSQMPDNLLEDMEDDTLNPPFETDDDFENIKGISEAMDSLATNESINCQGKKADKSRHCWTTPEEDVLIVALKDVISKGYKSENGFRNGYLPLLESAMKSAFSDTDIRGHPHITSKIHVWKKNYRSLSSMLAKIGIGWNHTENMLDATNEAWEAQLKVDNSVRVMRYKRWPYYED
ncbi:uncharacterized protein LOC142537781 [Primulina tabacum]|uniref:uncharacterized protein LOC142537781 n=1 Tax=Primulina tabacum TaxID=48773 RepID=UPI003F59DB07